MLDGGPVRQRSTGESDLDGGSGAEGSGHSGVKKCYTVVKFWLRLGLSLRFWAFGCEKVLYCREVLVAIGALVDVLGIRV